MCPSGLRSAPRKRVLRRLNRGFKSHRHRVNLHNPLLSIVVLNFNQQEDLLKNLENSIELDSLIQSGEITFLIGDNHSEDQEKLREIREKFPEYVTWIVQPWNLGVDGQISYFTDYLRSKYVLFLGSGDCIPLNLAKEIVQILKRVEASMVFLPATHQPSSKTNSNTRISFKETTTAFSPYIGGVLFNLEALKHYKPSEKAGRKITEVWPHVIRSISLSKGDAKKKYKLSGPGIVISTREDDWHTVPGNFFFFDLSITVLLLNPSLIPATYSDLHLDGGKVRNRITALLLLFQGVKAALRSPKRSLKVGGEKCCPYGNFSAEPNKMNLNS